MKWRFAAIFLVTFALLLVVWWWLDVAALYRVTVLRTVQLTIMI